MDQLSSTFRSVLSNPEYYLDPTERMRETCLQSTKHVYAICKASAAGIPTGPLAELYTEGFDIEQVWEQLQLLNVPLLSHVSKEVDKVGQTVDFTLLSQSAEESDQRESEEPEEGNEQECVVENEESEPGHEDEGSEPGHEDEESEPGHEDSEQGKCQDQVADMSSTVPSVKPNFFDLNAMEKYLKEAELKAMQDAPGEDEDTSDDEEFEEESKMDARYEDFFDPPDKHPVVRKSDSRSGEEEGMEQVGDEEVEEDSEDVGREEWEESEDDSVEGEEEAQVTVDCTDETKKESSTVKDKLSSFEKSQKKLQKQIASIESANLSDKPWQMVGEVTDHSRPVNSLLEEDVEFERVTRPQPVITEEKTQSLEDVIRQRVIDEAWDDVEKKVKPKEKPYNYSLRQPLDQEKSKLSLAQVYEQEYVQKTQECKEEKEDERHKEINELMKSLFVKLDALSNFFFTPKPVKPEVKIVANVPAVSLEEVAPVTMSDAKLLAPEEILPKSRREEVGDTEKTAVDRRRERRLKKKQKRLKVAQKSAAEKMVTRLKPGLGNKYSKQMMKNRLLSDVKSSSNFFAQLQDTVRAEVKAKSTSSQSQNPVVNHILSASYKL